MVNHFRTLLLNKSSGVPTYPGEEFVPINYVPRTLSKNLLTVHRIIFGVEPDRAMLNYRLLELMSIMHPLPLADHIYALDSRVTYWPPSNSNLFNRMVAGPSIVNTVDSSGLYLLNIDQIKAGGNQLYFAYNIEVIDGTHVKITPTATPGVTPVTHTYTSASGLSSVVSLPDTDVQFQFQPNIGAKWNVNWFSHPFKTLAVVFDDLKSGLTSDITVELFGVNPPEPFKTFRNLWEQGQYIDYRVSGVVLALGYRINELVA